jgi:hypothetical protein
MGRHKKIEVIEKKGLEKKLEKDLEKDSEKKSEKKSDEESEMEKDLDKEESKNESTTRPRGRPKKIIPQQSNTQQKPKIFELDENKEKSSIALHIPLYDDSSSEISQKNQFTMKDDSDENINSESGSESEYSEKKKKSSDTKRNNNLIVYLSDDESELEEDQNIKTLKKKLKKKEDMIKKLKDEIHTKSCDYNDSNYSYSNKKTPDIKLLNMKLLNLNKDNNLNLVEKTKIACWWCTLNFDTIPCFIPEKYYEGKFYVFGNFCSYNCSLAYILKDDDYKVANRVSLIKRLYSELYETIEPLFPSPPKELLNKFGGPFTIEEYRNVQKKLVLKEYKMKFNNVLQIPICFEEINREQSMKINYN